MFLFIYNQNEKFDFRLPPLFLREVHYFFSLLFSEKKKKEKQILMSQKKRLFIL